MELYKKIVHNSCGCIFSNGIEDENCLKRYYLLNDYQNGEQIKLYICNEYLRLLYAKEKSKYKDTRYYMQPQIEDVLFPVFEQYINIYDYKHFQFGRKKSLNDIGIRVQLCQQPKLYTYIPLLEAIEIIRLNNYIFTEFKNIVLEHIKDYINYYVKSKLSRNQYEKIITLSNAITKEWDSNKREVKINELFINILELKTK